MKYWKPENIIEDKKVKEAITVLKRYFRKHSKNVYYLKQLEVFFEKEFFHWITANAINSLLGEGFLKSYELPLGSRTRVKFVFNKSNRYYIRNANKNIKIIQKYSNPIVARACGKEAEDLFRLALLEKNFKFIGKDINKYKRKEWEESKHNLDFIIERDNIVYGCEVKNTYDYIDKKELDMKLRMCDYLGIRPLFIMRYAPKTYNYEIINRNGYTMIFETQVYPIALKKLVKEIKNNLKLPVDCPSSIPSGIIERFIKWHKKNL